MKNLLMHGRWSTSYKGNFLNFHVRYHEQRWTDWGNTCSVYDCQEVNIPNIQMNRGKKIQQKQQAKDMKSQLIEKEIK